MAAWNRRFETLMAFDEDGKLHEVEFESVSSDLMKHCLGKVQPDVEVGGEETR